jgi:peroxiredoxin
LWPHERSLVKKLEDKPFALLGVNTNRYNPEKLKKVMDTEKLNWRSFADHGGKEAWGPICAKWNLQGTPTLFILDHNGVIRYKWLGSPGEKKIDEAINKLIKEAEDEKNKESE